MSFRWQIAVGLYFLLSPAWAEIGEGSLPHTSISLPTAGATFDLVANRPRTTLVTSKGIATFAMLDTGAWVSVVKASALANFQFEILGTDRQAFHPNSSATDTNSSTLSSASSLVLLKHLSFDGKAFFDLYAYTVEDSSFVGAELAATPDLIIGDEPFSDSVLLIDFKAKVFRFATESDASSLVWAPFFDFGESKGDPTSVSPLPIVKGKQGEFEFPILIDTGHYSAVRVFNFPDEATSRNFTPYDVPIFRSASIGGLYLTGMIQGRIQPGLAPFSLLGPIGFKDKVVAFDFKGRKFGVIVAKR